LPTRSLSEPVLPYFSSKRRCLGIAFVSEASSFCAPRMMVNTKKPSAGKVQKREVCSVNRWSSSSTWKRPIATICVEGRCTLPWLCGMFSSRHNLRLERETYLHILGTDGGRVVLIGKCSHFVVGQAIGCQKAGSLAAGPLRSAGRVYRFIVIVHALFVAARNPTGAVRTSGNDSTAISRIDILNPF
jgi:hypothetical protein